MEGNTVFQARSITGTLLYAAPEAEECAVPLYQTLANHFEVESILINSFVFTLAGK